MGSPDELQDSEANGEKDSDGFSESGNFGREGKIAEESDKTDAVPAEEGGKRNEEEEWGAGSQSENEVVAEAVRRHVTFAKTLIELRNYIENKKFPLSSIVPSKNVAKRVDFD